MGEKGSILIVDDDPSNIEILSEVLEADFDVLFATSGEQALELVRKEMPDLIALDVMMPGMNGYDVCKELKQEAATAHIPVIFVTALENDDEEARGLELGAIDYITKPIRPPIVRIRLRNHMELKQARDQLESLSVTDGLTGLANRRRFDQLLESEFRRLHRLKAPLSVIMIDVDHFKNFNDTYGHQAGDDCLRKVGAAIGRTVHRPQDMAARYGGEEFACILPETDHCGALTIAETIKTAIAGLGLANAGSSAADHVTASLGVATAVCNGSIAADVILRKADEQLYHAKENGRNRVSGFEHQ